MKRKESESDQSSKGSKPRQSSKKSKSKAKSPGRTSLAEKLQAGMFQLAQLQALRAEIRRTTPISYPKITSAVNPPKSFLNVLLSTLPEDVHEQVTECVQKLAMNSLEICAMKYVMNKLNIGHGSEPRMVFVAGLFAKLELNRTHKLEVIENFKKDNADVWEYCVANEALINEKVRNISICGLNDVFKQFEVFCNPQLGNSLEEQKSLLPTGTLEDLPVENIEYIPPPPLTFTELEESGISIEASRMQRQTIHTIRPPNPDSKK